MLIFAAVALFVSTPVLPGDFMTTEVADTSSPGASEMTEETVYKGRKIRLSAQLNTDGSWTGAAEFIDGQRGTVQTDAVLHSQSEALSAALSQAMAEVDKDRMKRGKP
jgi:hypothetical protein